MRAACHQLAHRIGRTAGASGGIARVRPGRPGLRVGLLPRRHRGGDDASSAPARAVRGARGGLRARCAQRAARPTVELHPRHGPRLHGRAGPRHRRVAEGLRRAAARRASATAATAASSWRTSRRSTSRAAARCDRTSRCTRAPPSRRRYKAAVLRPPEHVRPVRQQRRLRRGLRGCARRPSATSAAPAGAASAATSPPRPSASATGPRRRARAAGCACSATSSRARSDCVTGAVGVILQDLDGGPAQLDAFCASFEAAATQPQHAACLRASEQAYRELLAQQTGQRPDRRRRRPAWTSSATSRSPAPPPIAREGEEMRRITIVVCSRALRRAAGRLRGDDDKDDGDRPAQQDRGLLRLAARQRATSPPWRSRSIRAGADGMSKVRAYVCDGRGEPEGKAIWFAGPVDVGATTSPARTRR